MSRVLACLVGLFLVSSMASAQAPGGAAGPPQTPRRDTGQRRVGTSGILGQVVAADSGAPIRRATVRLNSSDSRDNRSTITDIDGRYEFRDLPAGRYTVLASKNSFIGASYGQTAPLANGKPVTLAEKQTVEKIDISLLRGAVIAGRVLDEFGEPSVGAAVTPLRPQFTQGQRRFVQAGRVTTNDIGEFRIFGLTPGRYYVSATSPAASVGTINGVSQIVPDTHDGYSPTYYPGTSVVTAAQPLVLAAGQTIGDVTIMMVPARTATITGIAFGSDGRPLANGGVTAIPRGGMATSTSLPGNFGQLRPDGTFIIPSVPPGDYIVRAIVYSSGPPAPGVAPVPPEVATAAVTVDGEDLSGVRLTPLVPIIVSGHVVLDDPIAAQTLKPSTIRLGPQLTTPDDSVLLSGSQSSVVKDDFTFEIKTPLRSMTIRVTVPQPGSGPRWGLKSVRVGGVDVTDTGIDVGSRDSVDDVEIELTSHMPQVTGIVTRGNGEPVAGSYVLLFPQDRDRWMGANNRYFVMSRSGDDGGFKVSTLPPGNYYALASDRLSPDGWEDPEFLENVRRDAFRLSLGAGESRTLDLKLVTPR